MKDISSILQIFVLLHNHRLPFFLKILQLLHFLLASITAFVHKMHVISTHFLIRFNQTSPIENTTPYISIITGRIKTKFPTCVLFFYFSSVLVDFLLQCFYLMFDVSNWPFLCVILFLLILFLIN